MKSWILVFLLFGALHAYCDSAAKSTKVIEVVPRAYHDSISAKYLEILEKTNDQLNNSLTPTTISYTVLATIVAFLTLGSGYVIYHQSSEYKKILNQYEEKFNEAINRFQLEYRKQLDVVIGTHESKVKELSELKESLEALIAKLEERDNSTTEVDSPDSIESVTKKISELRDKVSELNRKIAQENNEVEKLRSLSSSGRVSFQISPSDFSKEFSKIAQQQTNSVNANNASSFGQLFSEHQKPEDLAEALTKQLQPLLRYKTTIESKNLVEQIQQSFNENVKQLLSMMDSQSSFKCKECGKEYHWKDWLILEGSSGRCSNCRAKIIE